MQFDDDEQRAVRRVVIPFEDADAADQHAVDHGYPRYAVGALVFAVDLPTARPGQSR